MDSSRITIRPFKLSDIDDFMMWASDEKVVRFSRMNPFTSKDDGEFICKGDMGYGLASQYWGQGIATMAVKMALSSVFLEFPHMERLQALVEKENYGSQRVLEKCGFLKEGLMRKYLVLKGKTLDVVCFSFLSTDSVPDL
ncbi:GNAT domain [Macleaya cordata]|uniref:GNAT domain n=1 Tax=Macleaya cordata TaxID=56857 RepID=A0A200QYK6_MACCD|nr:GNAT domain [Macleaya cordata]